MSNQENREKCACNSFLPCIYHAKSPLPPQKEEWEKEFSGIFLEAIERRTTGIMIDYPKIESFIISLLVREREKTEKNISMLRQWLNEDRITDPKKMVTNEELKVWLTPKDNE